MFLLIWFITGIISAILAWKTKVPTLAILFTVMLGPLYIAFYGIGYFLQFCARMDKKRGVPESNPYDDF